MINGSQLMVCVLGLSHESGNETTNLYFHFKNSPTAQFQALQQAAKENDASTREVTYYHDTYDNLITIDRNSNSNKTCGTVPEFYTKKGRLTRRVKPS